MTDGRKSFSLLGMNDMLFAQMERLESAGADEVEAEIERSRSMAKLANSAVASASTAIQAARMQAQAQGQLACAVTMETTVPAALLGQRPQEAGRALPEPDDMDWEQIDAFLVANAANHSLSWLVDRASGALGVRVGHDELRERCAALGISPVELGGYGDPFAAPGETG